MSAVIAAPELIAQAASDLAGIGSTVNAAHLTAAAPTLSVLPAAADEVSARIAHLFSGYGREYQVLAGKAAAFQEQFAQHLTAAASAYAGAETVNVASLLQPLTAIATPVAGAAVAAQNVLIDLISNIATNIQIFLNASISTLFSFIFLSWLNADILALILAFKVGDILTSSPWFNLAINALLDATYPIFTTFPILGQLVSGVTSAIGIAVLILLLPYLFAALANF